MVNHEISKHREVGRPARLLESLRRIPGLEEADWDADGWADFGHGRKMLVEYKANVDAGAARQLAEWAKRFPDANVLIIAMTTTKRARDLLAEEGVGVVDATGNARVQIPGLTVQVESKAARGRERPRPRRLAGRSGVAAQAILLEPARDWKVQDLAERAAVSPALAHFVFTRLEGEGIVQSEGSGPGKVRRLIDPAALLDLWSEEESEAGVEELAIHWFAQSPSKLLDAASRAMSAADIDHAFTGAAAAQRQVPHLTQAPLAEAWISNAAPLSEVARSLDAEPAAAGANLVLRQARDDSPLAFASTRDVALANPFRIYRDTLHNPRRGAELAREYRRQEIAF